MAKRERFFLDWDLSRSCQKPSVSRGPSDNNQHNHDESSEEVCAVCLSSGEDTMLLPCAHQFHGKCILRWVDQNFSCPMCRQEISQFVPLNTNDPEIHKQFVDIWERHHYGSKTENPSEQERNSGDSENDEFSVSKPKKISLSEVAALEEKCEDSEEFSESVEPLPGGENIMCDSAEEIKTAIEEITLTEEQIHNVAEEIVDFPVPEILVDAQPSPFSTLNFRSQPCFSPARSLHFGLMHHDSHDSVHVAVRQALTTAGKEIYKRGVKLAKAFLNGTPKHEDRTEKKKEVLRITIRAPTSYKLNESLEAGFLAGCLTASLLTATARPANLYPLFREVVPNVAIFFTVYEDLKSRNMNPNTDTKMVSFCKRTICAGAAATLGHLPQNRFKVTVPVRFGLQFGFFELFKDRLCEAKGDSTKDHSKLSPFAIGASALCGGLLAATSAYPVELYMKYTKVEDAAYLASYQTFMKRFLPGCVFTAMSFEFGRRWIHSKDEYDED